MSNLLKNVCIKNFGPIKNFSCNKFSNINLIIGENGTGKSFLLKALYSLTKSMEEYHKGDNIDSINKILKNKLRWTFQVNKLGDLVSNSTNDSLTLSASLESNNINYEISKETIDHINKVQGAENNRKANSIFIPGKEVFSFFAVILKSRQIDQIFGFDDTYFDLVKALYFPLKKDNNDFPFTDVHNILTNLIGGKIDYNYESGKWYFEGNNKQSFAIGVVSDGIKKTAELDRLLSNGYLTKDSIVFIDEIESSINPDSLCTFLDVINILASKFNIQFFLSSNSYILLRKLQNLAINNADFITCISLTKDNIPIIFDMKESMINNSINNTSIKLYKEEISKVL